MTSKRNNDENIVGQNIMDQRKRLGMSQIELAKKLGYKSSSTIAKIESGVNDVPLTKLEEIARALDSTPMKLMGWDKDDSPKEYNGMPLITRREQYVLIPSYRDVVMDEQSTTGYTLKNEKLNSVEIPLEIAKEGEVISLLSNPVSPFDITVKNIPQNALDFFVKKIDCFEDFKEELFMGEIYLYFDKNKKKSRPKIDCLTSYETLNSENGQPQLLFYFENNVPSSSIPFQNRGSKLNDIWENHVIVGRIIGYQTTIFGLRESKPVFSKTRYGKLSNTIGFKDIFDSI